VKLTEEVREARLWQKLERYHNSEDTLTSDSDHTTSDSELLDLSDDDFNTEDAYAGYIERSNEVQGGDSDKQPQWTMVIPIGTDDDIWPTWPAESAITCPRKCACNLS